MKNLIDNFIKDVTQVKPMPKSEVRERLNEILESIVPKAQNEEFAKHDLESAVTPNVIKLLAKQVGYNACRSEVIRKIEKL